MMHTKKIILVPHDITEKKKPIDKILKSLDAEMENILQNKTIPADIKVRQYSQLLHQYQGKLKIKQKPYKLEIEEPDSLISSEAILESIPKTQLSKARNLLEFVKKNPLIEILQDGKVSINGEVVKGSDIVSLIHDFSRGTKSDPVPGAEEFASALNALNVPLDIVGNKNRHELFTERLFPWEWDE